MYRYIRETVEVQAALAPTLAEVMGIARTKAFVWKLRCGTGGIAVIAQAVFVPPHASA